jgi:hypothetical protein
LSWRVEELVAATMPGGYFFDADPNGVVGAVARIV